MALRHSLGNLRGSGPKALGDVKEPGTGLVFSRDQGVAGGLPRGAREGEEAQRCRSISWYV